MINHLALFSLLLIISMKIILSLVFSLNWKWCYFFRIIHICLNTVVFVCLVTFMYTLYYVFINNIYKYTFVHFQEESSIHKDSLGKRVPEEIVNHVVRKHNILDTYRLTKQQQKAPRFPTDLNFGIFNNMLA